MRRLRARRQSLFSRIYGCEAAGNIANTMGDVVEGLNWREIEKRYGFYEQPVAQDKKDRRSSRRFGPEWVYHAHHRPPGMVEDGFERHRLCTSAILKKGGRIGIEDLARTWVEDIDPKKFGYLLGPQDQVIFNLLKSGLPPWEVGRYADWPGFIGTSKMIMPVGMVNACRPDQAARDALDIARIKDVQGRPGNFALEVAAGIAAGHGGSAASLGHRELGDRNRAGAIARARPARKWSRALEWARRAKDWKELRPLYEKKYEGKPISNAVEVLSGGLACFYAAQGRPREAILYAVNLGRDTDCKAYVAGGLAGAMRGVDALPKEWVETGGEAGAHRSLHGGAAHGAAGGGGIARGVPQRVAQHEARRGRDGDDEVVKSPGPGTGGRSGSRCCGSSGRAGSSSFGHLAVLDVAADQVAEHAAEILVARVGHERARVGQHADEAREQAAVGQRVHLPFHAFLLVEEPPAGAELDLAGDACRPGSCRSWWRST